MIHDDTCGIHGTVSVSASCSRHIYRFYRENSCGYARLVKIPSDGAVTGKQRIDGDWEDVCQYSVPVQYVPVLQDFDEGASAFYYRKNMQPKPMRTKCH
jgi:hypothetical protein